MIGKVLNYLNFGRKAVKIGKEPHISMPIISSSPPIPLMDSRYYRPMLSPLNRKAKKELRNPGFHFAIDFLSENETSELLKETIELKNRFSFIAGEPITVYTKDIAEKNIKENDKKFQVVPRRVTGRPEINNFAPWGYGETFKHDCVTPELGKVAKKIQSHFNFFHGGPKLLRDITINYRDYGMFRLDPHVDPLEDGSFVFILGLESDVVLTLSPPNGPLHRTGHRSGIQFY